MVWSVFNHLLTQKLPRKAKVALAGLLKVQKVAENAKVAQKLPSTIYLCLPTADFSGTDFGEHLGSVAISLVYAIFTCSA